MKITPNYHDLMRALITINMHRGENYSNHCILSQATKREFDQSGTDVSTSHEVIHVGKDAYIPADHIAHHHIVVDFDTLMTALDSYDKFMVNETLMNLSQELNFSLEYI